MNDPAKLAYEAYMQGCGIEESLRHEFEDLRPNVKLGWANAVRAVMEQHIVSITAENGDTIILVAPSEDFDLDLIAEDFLAKEGETVHNENIRFKDFLLTKGFEDLKIVSHKHPLDKR